MSNNNVVKNTELENDSSNENHEFHIFPKSEKSKRVKISLKHKYIQKHFPIKIKSQSSLIPSNHMCVCVN